MWKYFKTYKLLFKCKKSKENIHIGFFLWFANLLLMISRASGLWVNNELDNDLVLIPCTGKEKANANYQDVLGNPTDRGAWWVTIHRATKSWTQLKQLSMHAYALKYTFQYKYFILYTSNNACVTLWHTEVLYTHPCYILT